MWQNNCDHLIIETSVYKILSKRLSETGFIHERIPATAQVIGKRKDEKITRNHTIVSAYICKSIYIPIITSD